MYFLQQLKNQLTQGFHLNFQWAVWEWPAEQEAAAKAVEEKPKTPDEIKAGFKWVWEQAIKLSGKMDDTSAKLQDWADMLTWKWGEKTLEGKEWSDMLEWGKLEWDLSTRKDVLVWWDGEPSLEDISMESERVRMQVERLRSGTPDEQKLAHFIQIEDAVTSKLNPSDAEDVLKAMEEFRSSGEFSSLSPDEVKKKFAEIKNSITSQKLKDLQDTISQNAWDVEAAKNTVKDSNASPAMKLLANILLWSNRANTYNQSVLQWGGWWWSNWSGGWEALSPSNGKQSTKYTSSPFEKSANWVTLCSKTARLNLGKMWVDSPFQGDSARASYQMYGNGGDTGFPQWAEWKKVADVYLDASAKNAKYGHRVAAFEDKGSWFILDPYYSIPVPGKGGEKYNNQIGVPAEDYLNHMCEIKWRKYWWAQYPMWGWGWKASRETAPSV